MANLGLLSFVATNEGNIVSEKVGQINLYTSDKEIMTSSISPNGNEIFCTKDKFTKSGIYKEYYKGLEKVSYTHKNAYKDGTYIQLHEETGHIKFIAQCKDDVHHGDAKYYKEDGVLASKGTYYNGEINGPCSIFDSTGLKIKDVYYNKGIMYMINEYYPTGELKCKYDIKDNKVNGIFISFYLNGKINVKVPYVNGKCHGLETTYSVEGNLIAEINYYEGIRHGSCSYYDSKGDIIDIYLYQNGNIVKY